MDWFFGVLGLNYLEINDSGLGIAFCINVVVNFTTPENLKFQTCLIVN